MSKPYIISTINTLLPVLLAEGQKDPKKMDMQLIIDTAEKLGAAIFALSPDKVSDGERDAMIRAFFDVIDPSILKLTAEQWKSCYLLGMGLRDAQHRIAADVSEPEQYMLLLKLTDQFFLGAHVFVELAEKGLLEAFSLKRKGTSPKDESTVEEIADGVTHQLQMKLSLYEHETTENPNRELDIRKKLLELCSHFQWQLISAIPGIPEIHSINDILQGKLNEPLASEYKTVLEQYHTLEFFTRTLQNPLLPENECLTLLRERIDHEHKKDEARLEQQSTQQAPTISTSNANSSAPPSQWREILRTLREVLSNLISAKYFKFFSSNKKVTFGTETPIYPKAIITTGNLPTDFIQQASNAMNKPGAEQPQLQPHEVTH